MPSCCLTVIYASQYQYFYENEKKKQISRRDKFLHLIGNMIAQIKAKLNDIYELREFYPIICHREKMGTN